MATGRRRLLGSLGALVVLSACGNDVPTAALPNAGAAKQQVRSGVRSAGVPKARLRQARFFVTGDRNPPLLAAIRAGTDAEISFNGHYSIAFVSCGLSCFSYWFVDRHTGGVIAAPESAIEAEFTWDIAPEADSDRVKMTFGPRDGIPENCTEQHFRLDGMAFTELGPRRPVECPTHGNR